MTLLEQVTRDAKNKSNYLACSFSDITLYNLHKLRVKNNVYFV